MMQTVIVLAFSLMFATSATDGQTRRPQKRAAHSTRLNCLPPGISLTEPVSYGMKEPATLTVQKKLSQMGAQCRNGKLVDRKRREIRFHRPSCWGNPPADYQEIQQREHAELQQLQRRYTVIVFGCNPMIQ